MKSMEELRKELMRFYEDGEADDRNSEEMDEAQEKCKKEFNKGSSILNIRSRIYALIDIVTICRAANSSLFTDISGPVNKVLYFQVVEELKKLDEDISNLWNKFK